MKKIFSLCLAVMLIFFTVGCTSAAKVKTEKIKFDKKLLKTTEFIDAGAKDTPLSYISETPEEVTIFGDAVANQGQMVNFIKKRNANPKINCTVEELVKYYYEEAELEGIRPDIAICQAIKETGTWNYGGDVVPEQNNYCGLGTTGGGVKGAFFSTPQIGVRAHIQHLLSYATKRPPKVAIVDPRYDLIKKFRPQIFGKIQHWTGLNGVWAVPGKQYGQDILNLWQQAQIPDESDASLAYANARLDANSQIENAPIEAELFIYRGLVYYARKDYWAAKADFETAISIQPNLSEAIFNLALTQEKLKRHKDAIKTYNKYLQLQPNSELGYYNRGNLYLQQKNYKKAIEDFRHVLKIEDRFFDAHNQIALAYFRQKKYNDALKEIRRAAEVNTTDKIINKNKSALEACIKK